MQIGMCVIPGSWSTGAPIIISTFLSLSDNQEYAKLIPGVYRERTFKARNPE